MKRFYKFICTALLAGISFSCTDLLKEPDVLDISGEWKLYSAGTLDGSLVVKSDKAVEITVYAAFTADSKFELYQKLGEGKFRKYDGTYRLTGNVLTGLYGGKQSSPWGSSYSISLEESGNVLVMTDKNGNTCTYKRTAIPESVRNFILL